MIHHGDHHSNLRSLLGFMIVVMGAAILVLFMRYQDFIMGGDFNLYYLLSVALFCMLFVLYYLAGKPHKVAKSSKNRR